MEPTPRVAVIPGATGMVGHALARRLAHRGGWRVIGLARKAPAWDCGHTVVEVDVADPAACRRALDRIRGVTHVFHCARATHAMGEKESIDANLAMLRNVLDAVEAADDRLAHVHIVQGSKVYGSDLGPYRTPARESDPRVDDDNWYYAQEDLLRARSGRGGWAWSASRPHGVCDTRRTVPRSIAGAIAVYAAMLRELGEPLAFPGTEAGYRALYQSVDADLLAAAIEWIAIRPACANEAFNVTNGDLIRWCNLWPDIAASFDMPVGPVVARSLAEFAHRHAHLWDRIVQRHGLRPTPFDGIATWAYADFNLSRGYDVASCTLKLRRTGFHDCADTPRMLLGQMQRMRDERIVP